ncbi:hypothetical protein Cni_G19047 [Canna indica]|uniref:Fungal lipase-type domain-containing protein n=1 Tax=Canna indica TaxID=4628 RepID=A0AAQ3KQN4_9LILI|nr:hypothetical protein Cni_G19047 [Canna indica]
MDGLMLMKGAPSPGLVVGVQHHQPTAKVIALGSRAAAVGGGRALETSTRRSYMFPFRLWRLWPGGREALAEKGSKVAAAANVEDSEARKGERLTAATAAEQRGSNWLLKILRVSSMWSKNEQVARGAQEEVFLEEADTCVGCGNRCQEDGSEGCVVDGDGEENMVFDRESFSRLLRRVSLVEAELYAKMAYLGSLAYMVSKIKAKNLLKRYGLRFVVSSLEKKSKSSNEEHMLSQDHEMKKETNEIKQNDKKRANSTHINAFSAYQIAASAASYLQSQTTGILPNAAGTTNLQTGQDPIEGNSKHKQGRSPEEASFAATTNSVTSVVAGKEEMKHAVAKDLNSAKSLPCEWYICDDDSSGTRYFVIQGSETLASWQTNLLFEPIEFEGLDVAVHRGIYEAAKGMYQQMLPEVRAHMKSHGESAMVRFTGHSLGGSLALLVNLMLLIREETPVSSLLPVITFGAPTIMCGGDYILHKLGLPKDHVQAITMHRDIVPRAFSCNYPDHVIQILKAINSNFRTHPCLKNKKLLYAPMGKFLILQPDEKFSPPHQLLPAGTGLYMLGETLADSDYSDRQLQAASLAFLNSPHPLEILSDRCAYGSEGTVYRDHDTNSYLRSVRGVIHQEIKLIRKNRREKRRKMWWPIVAMQDKHSGVISSMSVGSTNSTQQLLNFANAVHGGRKTLKRFAAFVASQHEQISAVLLFPTRLLLLGALSLVFFR